MSPLEQGAAQGNRGAFDGDGRGGGIDEENAAGAGLKADDMGDVVARDDEHGGQRERAGAVLRV